MTSGRASHAFRRVGTGGSEKSKPGNATRTIEKLHIGSVVRMNR